MSTLNKLFGDMLAKAGKDDTIETSKALEGKKTIAVYFSAHWCPPCRGFTPQLAKVYNEIRKEKKAFEVVFVSSDQNQKAFDEYFAEMPGWLALPFEDRDRKKALSEKYGVRGIPTLVFLDGEGNLMTDNGRALVSEHGAQGFPFTDERVEELKAEVAKQQKEAAAKLETNGLAALLQDEVVTGKFLSKPDEGREAVALLLGGTDRGFKQFVLPACKKAATTLGKRFTCVFAPLDGDEDEIKKMAEESTGLHTVWTAFGDKGKPVRAALRALLGELDSPQLAVFSSDSKKLLEKDAARFMYESGASGFPWTPEARERLEQEKKEAAAKVKDGLKGLEFLSSGDRKTLLSQGGKPVAIKDVAEGSDVVGVYFSAHWCGPCRFFTPSLAKVYEQCKAAGKKFEVVFVSSDSDQKAFDEYFAEMPWKALPYADRALKDAISDFFEVRGIPTLVLLNPKTGEVITKQGRKAAQFGAEYFPWSPEQMKKAEDEAEEKARIEEEAAAARLAAYYKIAEAKGTACFTDHKGEKLDPKSVTVTASEDGSGDTVEFRGGFTTIALPGRSVETGKDGRLDCEVTVLEARGIQQFGFACEGFTANRGNGVGDDDKSWGVDGTRVLKWGGESGEPENFGVEWKKGDVVQLSFTVEHKDGAATGTMRCGVNGKSLGAVFEGVKVNGKAFPAFSAGGGKYQFNFREDGFKHEKVCEA